MFVGRPGTGCTGVDLDLAFVYREKTLLGYFFAICFFSLCNIYIYTYLIYLHAFAHNCRLSILGSSVQRVFHYKMPIPTGLSMIDSGTPLSRLIQNNTSVRDSQKRDISEMVVWNCH